jgi:predicted Fe-Mo cluster-binding NifX family protein
MTKIAIPTDDGLHVRLTCCRSRAFLVATLNSGKIIHQELRWNLLSEMMTSKFGYFYNLNDCDVVIVKEVEDSHKKILISKNMNIVRSEEKEITTALLKYLKNNPVHFEEQLNERA